MYSGWLLGCQVVVSMFGMVARMLLSSCYGVLVAECVATWLLECSELLPSECMVFRVVARVLQRLGGSRWLLICSGLLPGYCYSVAMVFWCCYMVIIMFWVIDCPVNGIHSSC